MEINRLDSFTALQKQLLDGPRERTAAGEKPGEPTTDRPDHREADQVPGGDRVEISPKAMRLSALHHAMEQGRAALASLPEVRPDRVAEVRSRLHRGFYNSVEVRSRVAERLGSVARHLEDA